MSNTIAPLYHPLTRRLDAMAELKSGDTSALESLPLRLATLNADHDIAGQGGRPTQFCVLLEGWR